MLGAFVLGATAFAILGAGTIGALLPIAALRALGAPDPVLVAGAIVGGLAGVAGAYILGDRLNDRVGRLRAPIGSAAIGVDGIRWRHWGKTRFIGWASVLDVYRRGGDAIVQIDGGAGVILPMRETNGFVNAARDALHLYREGEPAETIAPLDLADGDVADWLGRARALLRGGSYREADIGEERCVRVATDPRAPLAQRIGSAAALSQASEEAQERVRVAIEQTADPKVAHALEDALDERDDPRALASMLRRS